MKNQGFQLFAERKYDIETGMKQNAVESERKVKTAFLFLYFVV